MQPPKPNLKVPETISDAKYALNMDDELVKKYEDRFVAKKRRERILPPIKLHTCTFTLGKFYFFMYNCYFSCFLMFIKIN